MIRFFKFHKLYFSFSTIIITLGIFSLIFWGFNLSIDFTGGSVIEYKTTSSIKSQEIKNLLIEKKIDYSDLKVTDSKISLKTVAIDEKKEAELRLGLSKLKNSPVEILRYETVGPTVGKDTVRKTIFAVLFAITGILLYIAFAFKNISFAISAVIALFHDILVVVGMYSVISHFFGAELDLLFVTALLTTLAFSVHDTIVVFDQIRENYKKNLYTRSQIEENADNAVNSTMVRSLNNSLTIIFMLVSLILLGGETIRFFAVALLIGTITGTYSSPFISVPIAVFLEKRK